MRALKLGCGLLIACASACLSTQDVSLGELSQDAAVEASAPPPDDLTPPGERVDASAPRPGTEPEEPEEPEEREDATVGLDAGAPDARPADASDSDSNRMVDADAAKPDAASDASSADAADVNIRCLLEPWEPWHC